MLGNNQPELSHTGGVIFHQTKFMNISLPIPFIGSLPNLKKASPLLCQSQIDMTLQWVSTIYVIHRSNVKIESRIDFAIVDCIKSYAPDLLIDL